jgi:hypothetical protein
MCECPLISRQSLSIPAAQGANSAMSAVLHKHQRTEQQRRSSDGFQVGRPEFDFRQGQGIASLILSVRAGSGTHPPSYSVGTGGVKRSDREADHASPFTEVNTSTTHTSSWRRV